MKNALKEWNTTVEALGNGKIIAVWRKGGIADSPGISVPLESFQVEEKRFLLFPTFSHQSLDKIKKSFWEYFNQNHKLGIEHQLQIKYWAEVHEEIEIETEEQLLKISNELVYSDEHIKYSFNLYPNHKGKLLLLRVYSLNYPVLITDSPDYGGCKSWVELKIDIPRIRSTPALSFKDFSQQVRNIKSILELPVSQPTLLAS